MSCAGLLKVFSEQLKQTQYAIIQVKKIPVKTECYINFFTVLLSCEGEYHHWAASASTQRSQCKRVLNPMYFDWLSNFKIKFKSTVSWCKHRWPAFLCVGVTSDMGQQVSQLSIQSQQFFLMCCAHIAVIGWVIVLPCSLFWTSNAQNQIPIKSILQKSSVWEISSQLHGRDQLKKVHMLRINQ